MAVAKMASISPTSRLLVTIAVLTATFLAAMDVTIVGTAMPTIVGSLGGMELLSWVFSAYLLTSAATVPIYGKLADMYGRRLVFLVGAAIFMLGSGLSGQSQSMLQLVLFRGLQGLGAGAVTPITSTIIGDIYSLQERARMQGVFSSVWGVSALVGPWLGGFIVDHFSWRWVFYVNIPFGLASMLMLARWLKEDLQPVRHRVDYLGATSLSIGIAALLFALLEGGTLFPWKSWPIFVFFAVALLGLAVFVWGERKAPEPVLPLGIFRNRIIAVSSLAGFLAGGAMQGVSSYVPVFVQGVLGGSATQAGSVLAPMSLGWPVGSVLAGQVILRLGYRATAVAGMAFATMATVALATAGVHSSLAFLIATTVVMGLGLGFSTTTFIIAVQNAVPWARRGVATASTQFVRTLGSTVSVAILGSVLNAGLVRNLRRLPSLASLPPRAVIDASNIVLDPVQRAAFSPAYVQALAQGLAAALHGVFLLVSLIAILGLGFALFFPGGRAEEHVYKEESY